MVIRFGGFPFFFFNIIFAFILSIFFYFILLSSRVLLFAFCCFCLGNAMLKRVHLNTLNQCRQPPFQPSHTGVWIEAKTVGGRIDLLTFFAHIFGLILRPLFLLLFLGYQVLLRERLCLFCSFLFILLFFFAFARRCATGGARVWEAAKTVPSAVAG